MAAPADPVPVELAAARLTRREVEVFWLVANRLRNAEIADQLVLSERTIESHVAALLRKLQGTDRSDLVRLGQQLRARREARAAIPQLLSSFVGRREEVAHVATLVDRERFVTLLGPAGVGKTRLAFEVAVRERGSRPAVLVDLATVDRGDDVPRAFASALGVIPEGTELVDAVQEALRHDDQLLVVDNCEHVAEAVAGLLGCLLTATHGLRVLATSRTPLRVPGEVRYVLAPLPLPSDSDDAAEILASPAGRLFSDRARAAAPGFEVDEANAPAVAALCRRLDGLPLAIELAAARTPTFSPSELLARLDERFSLLTDGHLDAPERHQTLAAALSWSYDLLDDEERVTFERCSVFHGDMDFDTAAAVVVFPPLTTSAFVRVFPRLVDRSLLSTRRLPDESTRYHLLESFRAFGRDAVAARGELAELSRRHAEHFLDVGTGLRAALTGPEQAEGVRTLDAVWTELHAAMRWLIAQDQPDRCWAFLAAVGSGWSTVGTRVELFDWLEALLARPLPGDDLGVRARTLASWLLLFRDARRAEALAEEAQRAAQESGPRLRAAAAMMLGYARSYLRDRDRAAAHLREAAELYREVHDTWNEAQARKGMGHAAADLDTALGHLQEAADLFGQVGDRAHRAVCLRMMAARAIDSASRLDDAERWLDEAAALAATAENTPERLHARLHRARLLHERGQHEVAEELFDELLPAFRRLGDQRCASRCLLGLGRAATAHGRDDEARAHLTECVRIAERVGERADADAALELLGRIERARAG